MRGSTWVPPERPVLRPPGTDNSAHRQVAGQPGMPSRLAWPIQAGLHDFAWYLTCERPANWGHVPSVHTQITAEHYNECALANKANYWGRTSCLT